MPRTISLSVLVLFFSFSRGNAENLGEKGGMEFFEKEIRPILVERCYQCHSAEGKIKGGLRLDSRHGIEQGGDSGTALTKGDANTSLLIEAVRYHDRDLQMPPKNRLPDHEVTLLEKWVNLGAPDPREGIPAAAPKAGGMSLEEGREFWSFQPVASPQVPVMEGEGGLSPVDAFVLAGFKAKKLTPAPPAEKRILIRRVTQDLTGLPPTPEEVARFLADDSADAFSQLVERLLDSPQYGIRWGRHWLDVARYADSNGLDENLGYGQSWRYRDYVVDSFNQDKPFDRFLVEQIAGDLVSHPTTESITGTGFLQLGPKVLAEPNRQKLDMDIIDEQLDTFGKAFLGMTFGCVRCHDHKFDPVSQADYYSLAAIFKGTRTLYEEGGSLKKWYEHSLGTAEEEEKFKEIEKQIADKGKAATAYKNEAITKIRDEAKSKAVDYLVAATRFDSGAPLSAVAEIAGPLGLHPRILHQCRRHIEFHRDDPLFEPWYRWAGLGDAAAIRAYYESLFEEANIAFQAAQKKDPKIKTLDDPRLESARDALSDYAGFLAVPTVDAFAFDKETLAEYYRLLEEQRAFESAAPDKPSVMSVCDGNVVPDLAIHIRGDLDNLGEKVSRNFPAVMQWTGEPPLFSDTSSGRLELANWMADPQHPLTARVIVNRVWAWHFGAGLVKTTENFGVMGDRPSHPELLDWLARHFMENGWSIKELHRVILNTKTYQQSARHPGNGVCELIDPENRLLWKSNLRRLEAEQVRDSILAVSGRLETTLGGKTLPLRNRQFVFNHTSQDHTTYHSLRRAVYLPVIRNHLYPLFEQFDYPDPTMPTGVRNQTVIAPQALVMMNDELIMDSSEALAHAVMSSTPDRPGRISRLYDLALGRTPTDGETDRISHFIEDVGMSEPEDRAWALVCQGVLASNEFIYLR